VKVLYSDRNGFCLYQKRLEKDVYQWPKTSSEVMPLGTRELHWLMEGLSLVLQDTYSRLAFSAVT